MPRAACTAVSVGVKDLDGFEERRGRGLGAEGGCNMLLWRRGSNWNRFGEAMEELEEEEEEEEAAAAAKQFAKLEAVVVVDIVLLESLPKMNWYTGRF